MDLQPHSNLCLFCTYWNDYTVTEKALKTKTQTVRMNRSHAMIILCGVCAQSRQCLAPSSVEQSGHCVMCRPAAAIMPITTSVGWVGCSVYGGNQGTRLGGES